MSSGGGSGTSTQTNEPWSGLQPYLSGGYVDGPGQGGGAPGAPQPAYIPNRGGRGAGSGRESSASIPNSHN